MKNPKPYVRKIGKNWKGILLGTKDDGKGRRSIVILGQPKNGFPTQQEAAEFVRNKWKRRQDMNAFASKAGNGSPVLAKDTVKEVRFRSNHPLHRGNNGDRPKRLTKKEQEKIPAYAAPEVTIDTRKNAIEFIITSAGINGRMVNEQEASRILDAIGSLISKEHELPQEDLMETLSDAYMDQQADLMNNDPADMKPEDVQAQLRYLDIRKNMLEQHIQ